MPLDSERTGARSKMTRMCEYWWPASRVIWALNSLPIFGTSTVCSFVDSSGILGKPKSENCAKGARAVGLYMKPVSC